MGYDQIPHTTKPPGNTRVAPRWKWHLVGLLRGANSPMACGLAVMVQPVRSDPAGEVGRTPESAVGQVQMARGKVSIFLAEGLFALALNGAAANIAPLIPASHFGLK